jgi:hypothetical protein
MTMLTSDTAYGSCHQTDRILKLYGYGRPFSGATIKDGSYDPAIRGVRTVQLHFERSAPAKKQNFTFKSRPTFFVCRQRVSCDQQIISPLHSHQLNPSQSVRNDKSMNPVHTY